MPNRLIHETSPYLLQHAGNPVDWYPYGNEAFETAKASAKPMLISIGYSACHWCHVMEHESFSKPEIAEVMNRKFICIKVDREERPDVDQVYMGAVQVLHGSGGWPLNCFALPDGRPFWGGTYFRPEQWLDVLEQISTLYADNYSILEEQADRILTGVGDLGLITLPDSAGTVSMEAVHEAYEQLSWSFDTELGGLRGSPKFPMPVVWNFVLNYRAFSNNPEALAQLHTTLQHMARGGIYDQIGGGFARYSTDAEWKVPHFEKMLYDNAQLISLYADMYRLTGDGFYRDIFTHSIEFVLRDLTSPEGLFYAALDADSEGEEGLYYLWKLTEIQQLMPEYAALLADYWGVDGKGHLDKQRNVLLRTSTDAAFASRNHLSAEELRQLVKMASQTLFKARQNRERPRLDDKHVLGWNALMIKALAGAYMADRNVQWLDAGLRCANLIRKKYYTVDMKLCRLWKNKQLDVPAFLDDYACLAEAYIALYQVTFDEKWLRDAGMLAETVIQEFGDPAGPLFWFAPAAETDKRSASAVARLKVISDGVEPSGNAVMARVFLALGHYTGNEPYLYRAGQMVTNLRQRFVAYPAAYSAWALNALVMADGISLVVITGPDAMKNAAELNLRFHSGLLIAASENASDLPVFRNRFSPGKNAIYICKGTTCSLPVSEISGLVF